MKTINYLLQNTARKCFAIIICIHVLNACSPVVDGILPKGYNWAYGWWTITEKRLSYDILINGSTVQTDKELKQLGLQQSELYPVYTAPEVSFSYTSINDDEIIMYYNDVCGQKNEIILNKKTKTVGFGSTCKKNKQKPDESVLWGYRSQLRYSPVYYRWKSIDNSKVIDLQYDESDVLTLDERVIQQKTGDVLSYDSTNKQLTILYKDGRTNTFRQYSKEQEIRENLVGNTFARGEGSYNTAYGNDIIVRKITFTDENNCLYRTYSRSFWGEKLENTWKHKWEVRGDNIVVDGSEWIVGDSFVFSKAEQRRFYKSESPDDVRIFKR